MPPIPEGMMENTGKVNKSANTYDYFLEVELLL